VARSDSIIVAVAVLIIIGPLTIVSASRGCLHCSNFFISSQSQQEDKPPTPPVTLSSHSGTIRRGVCRREAIKRVQPPYPTEAEKQNIKGIVTVEVVINEKGHVESARSLSGPDALKEAAQEAAKRWRFRVARIGGRPVKTTCALSFQFPPASSQAKRAGTNPKRAASNKRVQRSATANS
jgi:TonB family protein